MRTAPVDTDRFAYDIDAIRLGGTTTTLRDILVTACTIGRDEGIHDDAEKAETYSAVCWGYGQGAAIPNVLILTVAEARLLHDATVSALEYALTNNYDADNEPDVDLRIFGQNGQLMLGTFATPWTNLADPMDGRHGITALDK